MLSAIGCGVVPNAKHQSVESNSPIAPAVPLD